MSSKHEDIWSSLFAFAKRMKDELLLISPNLKIINWDAVSDLSSSPEDGGLPNQDVIGIGEVSWTDEKTVMITAMVAVSTWSDPDLIRLTKIIGYIKDNLKVDARLTLYDADTSAPKGFMVVGDGVEVMPVMRNTQLRPFQAVAVTLAEGAF